MTGKEAEVYAFIKANKPNSQTEIAEGLRMDNAAVHKFVKRLIADGRVDFKPAQYRAR